MFLTAIGVAALLLPAPGASGRAQGAAFRVPGRARIGRPLQINESFSLSVNGAVDEGLVRRRPDLEAEPCLATSWEVLDPAALGAFICARASSSTKARFHRRRRRFFGPSGAWPRSDLKGRIPADAQVVKVDDYTVDFLLDADPLLINEWKTLGHLLEEGYVRGARSDRGHRDERYDPALCRLARQWDGPSSSSATSRA